MRQTYSLGAAIETVARYTRPEDANDLPAIRTALNDILDAASKSGYRVNFNFCQDRAVKRVQNLIRK